MPRTNPGVWILAAIVVLALVTLVIEALTAPLSLWEDRDDA